MQAFNKRIHLIQGTAPKIYPKVWGGRCFRDFFIFFYFFACLMCDKTSSQFHFQTDDGHCKVLIMNVCAPSLYWLKCNPSGTGHFIKMSIPGLREYIGVSTSQFLLSCKCVVSCAEICPPGPVEK